MAFTVLSYNIWEGGGDRLGLVEAIIHEQQPNAVALLEADDRDNVEVLARVLGMQLIFGEVNNQTGGIAWLSRLPVRRAENHRHPGLAKTLLEIEVETGGRNPQLFATHLGSRWDVPQPASEIPIILDLLAPFAGQPHLLVGDFNALRPGDPVGVPPQGVHPRGDAVPDAPRLAIRRLLAAGYVDCYRALRPRTSGYTYPAACPWLRLDYIFASPDLAASLTACDVVQGGRAAIASDHLAIWAEFSL